MRSVIDTLSQYASYHRDRRNIATHVVGIPAIVLGIEALLSRPWLAIHAVPQVPLTLALGCTLSAGGFYVALDRRYGAAMAAFLGASLWIGTCVAALSTRAWLLGSAGLFVGGWVLQFIGHAFEGKKPAFVDDIVGLLVGPLFVVAEVGFALGLRHDVRVAIEERVGALSRSRGASSPRAPHAGRYLDDAS